MRNYTALKTRLLTKDAILLDQYTKLSDANEALLNIFKQLELEKVVMDYHISHGGLDFEKIQVSSRKYNMKKLCLHHINMEHDLYKITRRYINENSGLDFHVPVFDGHGLFEQGTITIRLQEENGVPQLSPDKNSTTYFFCSLHYYVSDKYIEKEDKKILIDFFGTYKNTVIISEELLTSASSNDPEEHQKAIKNAVIDLILNKNVINDVLCTIEDCEKVIKVLFKYLVPCYETAITSIQDMADKGLVSTNMDYILCEISIDAEQNEKGHKITLGVIKSVDVYEEHILTSRYETEVIPFPT